MEMKQIYSESGRLAQSIGFLTWHLRAGISLHNEKLPKPPRVNVEKECGNASLFELLDEPGT
jgi:hypothetical protein